MLGVVLHPCPTAGKGVERVTEFLLGPHPQRHKVAHHARLGILRCKNMIVQGRAHSNRHIHQPASTKQIARQLEHVVGIARLTGIVAQFVTQFVRLTEILVVAVTTDGARYNV